MKNTHTTNTNTNTHTHTHMGFPLNVSPLIGTSIYPPLCSRYMSRLILKHGKRWRSISNQFHAAAVLLLMKVD